MPRGEKTKNLWENPQYRYAMSEAHRGKPAQWTQDKIKRDIVRVKISHSKTGKRIPKMSLALMGRVYSQETIEKLKQSHIGKNTGEQNWNWKGGITPLTAQIRHCFKYHQWRSDIFIRDDYTCQMCEQRGVYLEADHYPKKFSEIFHENKITSLEQAFNCEELWNINNGRTLCRDCHRRKSIKIINFIETYA